MIVIIIIITIIISFAILTIVIIIIIIIIFTQALHILTKKIRVIRYYIFWRARNQLTKIFP